VTRHMLVESTHRRHWKEENRTRKRRESKWVLESRFFTFWTCALRRMQCKFLFLFLFFIQVNAHSHNHLSSLQYKTKTVVTVNWIWISACMVHLPSFSPV